uniref:Uncharacterized protein n=1 Tax=Anguilla anguilla TaxID=7936 RepID=A0A0E9US92_ANGAN
MSCNGNPSLTSPCHAITNLHGNQQILRLKTDHTVNWQ